MNEWQKAKKQREEEAEAEFEEFELPERVVDQEEHTEKMGWLNEKQRWALNKVLSSKSDLSRSTCLRNSYWLVPLHNENTR